MLPQTVTVTPYAGRGGDGPLYGDPVVVRCRIDYGRRFVHNPAGGDDLSIMATLFCAPDAAVKPQDLVMIDGLSRIVEVVDKIGGPDGGAHHIEVLLGHRLLSGQ